jgi:hypothetical protein
MKITIMCLLALVALSGCQKLGLTGPLKQLVGDWVEVRMPPGCKPKQIVAEEGAGVAVLCEGVSLMDIKQELEKIAGFIPVGESVREVASAALAEIERLEKELKHSVAHSRNIEGALHQALGEVRAERSLKNQARADLVKCADRLNAYTDRMITAGLMS